LIHVRSGQLRSVSFRLEGRAVFGAPARSTIVHRRFRSCVLLGGHLQSCGGTASTRMNLDAQKMQKAGAPLPRLRRAIGHNVATRGCGSKGPKAKSSTVLSDPRTTCFLHFTTTTRTTRPLQWLQAYFLLGSLPAVDRPCSTATTSKGDWIHLSLSLLFRLCMHTVIQRATEPSGAIDRPSRIPRPQSAWKEQVSSPSSPAHLPCCLRPTAKSSKNSLLDLYRPRPRRKV
jgi:hypothetical protein